MIFLVNSLWIVLVVMSGSTTPVPFPVGYFSTETDCKFVERQIKEKLHPKTAECIETPQQHQ